MFKKFIFHATQRSCVIRALKVAAVVGTILAMINHYEIFSGTVHVNDIYQVILTYMVPYCVSTYSSAMQAIYQSRK